MGRCLLPLPQMRSSPLRSDRSTSRSRMLTSSPTRMPLWRSSWTMARSRALPWRSTALISRSAWRLSSHLVAAGSPWTPLTDSVGDSATRLVAWAQRKKARSEASFRLIVAGARRSTFCR